MNIPQTSASERVEAARKALAKYDASVRGDYAANAPALAGALRSLIEAPETGTSEEVIVTESVAAVVRALDLGDDVRPSARNLHRAFVSGWLDEESLANLLQQVARTAARRAEQAAHESWEPADVPSQEFMLRHLGITHSQSETFGALHIPEQLIDLEVI